MKSILIISLFTFGSLAASIAPVLASTQPHRRDPHAAKLFAREHQAGFVKKRHVRRKLGKRASCKSGGSSSATSSAMNAYQTVASTVASSNSTTSDSDSSSSDSTTSESTTSNSNSTADSSSSSSTSGLPSGITHFTGSNSGIGSWFRTDNSDDSTNGRSWCQLNYQDTWMGFAPDVTAMLSDFGNDITKAGTAYCGLEAKATNPSNGNTALIYIVDGFDSKWVKTPQSVDLTLAAFKALYGSETSDKDIVITDLQWEFTGKRNSNYAFNAGS